MTRKIFQSSLVLTLALVLGACSADEDFYYNDVARAYLVGPEEWTVGSDSLTFSFVAYPSAVTEQTMMVEAQVMGPVSNTDRTVNISVDAEKTTASAAQYTVPQSVTVEAGQASVTFPVVLKRDASLASKAVRLCIKVAESADFAVGVNEKNHLTLIWNDILSRPKNWDDLEEFFGTYSDASIASCSSTSTEQQSSTPTP